MSTNADFDLFRTSEDHEALREAVRAVAEDKIAPYAAAVDEEARYPQEAHDALVAADFFAPARARGVRRRGRRRARDVHRHRGGRPGLRVAASLIPAVNKLGSMPLILAGSDDVKRRYLAAARRRASTTFSYGLSEREAGLRHRGDEVPGACATATTGCSTGQKSWITNAGVSEYYTVLAVTDPDGPRGGNVTRVRRREVRRGLHLRREGAQARHQGQPDPRAALRQRPHPRRPGRRRGRATA